MIRFGNTRTKETDSGEPLVTLQKKGLKLSLGTIGLLNLKPGDYVDVGLEKDFYYITRTGEETGEGDDLVKPSGRKLGKGNTISSNSIRGALSSIGEVFEVTEETMEVFDMTWYKMTPGVAQSENGANEVEGTSEAPETEDEFAEDLSA